jgi:hypothetical protein
VNESAVPAGRFLYRFAGVRSRKDSPSIAELEMDGWSVGHLDPRYGTALCMKVEEQSAGQQLADEDEAAELFFGGGAS